jgi:hypothetical protein
VRDVSPLRPYFIALGAGAALWTITAVATRRIEPWDAGAYWTVSYPLAIVLAAALGYGYPQRPWRWAVAIVFMQVPVMLLRGAGFGLLPLGMALLAVLCVPPVVLAGVAARARLRRDAG